LESEFLQEPPAASAKAAYERTDLERAAACRSLPIRFPARPLDALPLLRVASELLRFPSQSTSALAFCGAAFRACWELEKDPAAPATLAWCCDQARVSHEEAAVAARRENTAVEAPDHPLVFATPSFVLLRSGSPPELFVGFDRIRQAAQIAREMSDGVGAKL